MKNVVHFLLIKIILMLYLAKKKKICYNIKNDEKGYLIEGVYLTEFSMAQRILSFGANCILLEPQELKAKIVDKIKEMRKNYGC